MIMRCFVLFSRLSLFRTNSMKCRTMYLKTVKNESVALKRFRSSSAADNEMEAAKMDDDLPKPLVVQQNKSYFYIKLAGYQRATLKYFIEDGVMTIVSVVVPEKVTGRGLGYLLVKAAIDSAIEDGFKLRILCSFARRFIDEESPEYKQYEVKE